MNKTARISFTKYFQQVDWKLLLFLVLFLDVKLLVKVFAVILLYLLRPDFRFAFKWKHSRLPLFYPVVIGIAILNCFLYSLYSSFNYDLALLFGIFSWLLCILAIHQVKLSVEKKFGCHHS